MLYAPYIWNGVRPGHRFNSEAEAIAWIEKEMEGWLAPGDSLKSYSADKGFIYFIETEHGDITDAWASLRIIGG